MAKQSGSPGHMKPGQQGHKSDDMKPQHGGSPGQQQAAGGSDRQQGAGKPRGDTGSDKTAEASRKGGKS